MPCPTRRDGGPAFRHDPVKSTLLVGPDLEVDWSAEPAVCGYRKLTATHARTGAEVEVPVSASPAVVSGLGVVLASDDGHVRLLDQRLGKVYWHRRLDRSIYASLVVDSERRTVIVASTGGLIACFTLRGELAWSQALPHPVFATPTISVERSLLHLATFDSTCYGLRLGDGAIAFEAALPKPWYAAHGGVAAHRDVYSSPVLTAASTVVFCAGEHVVCLAADGSTVWSRDLGVGMKASPVAVRGPDAVAVFAVDGSCRLLSATDGSVLRATRLGAKITASPAVSGRTIAVGTQDGRAYGLDAGRSTCAGPLRRARPGRTRPSRCYPAGTSWRPSSVATPAAGEPPTWTSWKLARISRAKQRIHSAGARFELSVLINCRRRSPRCTTRRPDHRADRRFRLRPGYAVGCTPVRAAVAAGMTTKILGGTRGC